jgi:hypothetical protein
VNLVNGKKQTTLLSKIWTDSSLTQGKRSLPLLAQNDKKYAFAPKQNHLGFLDSEITVVIRDLIILDPQGILAI